MELVNTALAVLRQSQSAADIQLSIFVRSAIHDRY